MNNSGETGSAEAEPADPKLETAVFGREVEDFIEHDRIGQYLIDKARADLEEASAALIIADPTDTRHIAALQLEARVAQRVRGWIAEAIQSGRQAAQLLQEERDEHGN